MAIDFFDICPNYFVFNFFFHIFVFFSFNFFPFRKRQQEEKNTSKINVFFLIEKKK